MYDKTTKRWVLIDLTLFEIGSYSKEVWILFHKRQPIPRECEKYEDLFHLEFENDDEFSLTREMYESFVTRNPSLGGWVDADDDLMEIFTQINIQVFN